MDRPPQARPGQPRGAARPLPLPHAHGKTEGGHGRNRAGVGTRPARRPNAELLRDRPRACPAVWRCHCRGPQGARSAGERSGGLGRLVSGTGPDGEPRRGAGDGPGSLRRGSRASGRPGQGPCGRGLRRCTEEARRSPGGAFRKTGQRGRDQADAPLPLRRGSRRRHAVARPCVRRGRPERALHRWASVRPLALRSPLPGSRAPPRSPAVSANH